jgi:hypothetical protein
MLFLFEPVMVQHQEELAPRLDLPAEDAVEAHGVGDIVVLEDVRPGDLRGERQVEADPGQALGEVPFGKAPVVLLVLQGEEDVAAGAELERRVHLPELSAVEASRDDLCDPAHQTRIRGLAPDPVAREAVASQGNHHARVDLEGLPQ